MTELLVFGSRAGKAAAQFALDNPRLNTASLELQAAEEQERISRNFFRKDGGSERIFTLRKEMNETMETSAGIYRSEKSLKETCNKIKELKDRFSNIIIAVSYTHLTLPTKA